MIFKYHAKFNKRAGVRQLWMHENHAVELSELKGFFLLMYFSELGNRV
jgi:hypothetical protein